jgi:hypothetical protein
MLREIGVKDFLDENFNVRDETGIKQELGINCLLRIKTRFLKQ